MNVSIMYVINYVLVKFYLINYLVLLKFAS